MKKILFFLFAIALATPAFSQIVSQPEKIVVNKSDLTTSQLLKIESDARIAELQKKLDTYGNWVGVGGEIGTAVKEGLNAVVDVSERFGKTDVGKFTLVMIAWKVMGKDSVRIILGILLVLIAETILFLSLRRLCFPRKVCIETNGWQFWKPRTYKVIEPSFSGEGLGFIWFLHILGVIGTAGIAYAIMFA